MYYKDYMKNYYLKHKEKIKKRSEEWRKNNPGRIKVIRSRYKTKRESAIGDFREEKIEMLPFEERISPETLLRLKENSRSNQGRVKYYELVEGVFSNPYIKKKALEGM